MISLSEEIELRKAAEVVMVSRGLFDFELNLVRKPRDDKKPHICNHVLWMVSGHVARPKKSNRSNAEPFAGTKNYKLDIQNDT